jgi:hypothetical protein
MAGPADNRITYWWWQVLLTQHTIAAEDITPDKPPPPPLSNPFPFPKNTKPTLHQIFHLPFNATLQSSEWSGGIPPAGQLHSWFGESAAQLILYWVLSSRLVPAPGIATYSNPVYLMNSACVAWCWPWSPGKQGSDGKHWCSLWCLIRPEPPLRPLWARFYTLNMHAYSWYITHHARTWFGVLFCPCGIMEIRLD